MSALLAALDGIDDLPFFCELRERTYFGLGDVVVDVGCGAGRAVGELGRRGVRAIGVDVDPGIVQVAVRRWPRGEFRVGDATDLPLEDGSVSGYRADKVLHNLSEPVAAVVEARRVLRRGGRAVLVGQDWDTLVIDSADPAATRAAVHARADVVPSPRVARQQRNLLLDNGFTDVTVEVWTAVFTGAVILPVLAGLGGGEWVAEQVERAAGDRLFVAVPLFLAVGTRVD